MLLNCREPQKLMDELDVPAERAALFDVIDADNSGTLALKELGQGLLHVRSESGRNDGLACVLRVGALLEMVRGFQTKHDYGQRALAMKLDEIRNSLAGASFTKL